MTTQELYDAFCEDLKKRTTWEDRQKVWYTMCNGGLRRKRKPWPNAADLHYPLANSIINKFVPFYINQIYSAENLASFTPRKPQMQSLRYAAESWFNYMLRERSNFETEMMVYVSAMLRCGISFMKTSWDEANRSVKFDAVNPMYLVFPYYTKDMDSCDRICHIMEISEGQYRRNEAYKQDDDFIKRIKGEGNSAGSGVRSYDQHKLGKQGLTEGSMRDNIIIWECYYRDKNGKIIVETFSPQAPDEPIRPKFELPYSHGQMPFVPCMLEFTPDKGFYSSRGVCETVAAFEAALTKTMNAKADAMSLYNSPMFSSDQDIPNVNNIKFGTGVLLPTGVKPVLMPQPPISFDQEMVQMRQVSEYLVSMPDYGLTQGRLGSSKPRTATEVQNIGQLMGVNTDLRIKLFRLALSEIYKQAYAILVEYAHDQLLFEYQNQFSAVPAEAIIFDYQIKPSGSADGVNRVMQYQKALVRFQTLRNDPYINQPELRKDLLEVDDPHLVNRMLIDPQLKKQMQAEEAGSENLLLDQGFAAVAVEPADDHEVHVQIHMDRLQLAGQRGQQLAQDSGAAYTQHLQQHIQFLSQTNPNLAKQIGAQIMKAMQAETKNAQFQQMLPQ